MYVAVICVITFPFDLLFGHELNITVIMDNESQLWAHYFPTTVLNLAENPIGSIWENENLLISLCACAFS